MYVTKWILLEFYNRYDQNGGYFAGVFDSYAKAEKAAGRLGREDWEDEWYEAREYKVNKLIDEDDRG